MSQHPQDQPTGDLKREIRWRPAFDRRDPNPNKNYGIHGVDMTWLLIGREGAVQWVLYTAWHLPHVQAELDAKSPHPDFPYLHHKPLPADIGYHSKVPRYEGQTALRDSCEFTDGGPCYYDGSGLGAHKGFDLLCAEGEEAVWQWMEEWYRETLLNEVNEL